MLKNFREIRQVERLADQIGDPEIVRIENSILYENKPYPIFSFRFGADDPTLPTLAIVGGVHGLEKVGTHIALSLLETFHQYVQWDQITKYLLNRCRVVFYPLANPIGMMCLRRSNGNGVDLMRNAPLDAEPDQASFLVGGHRISNRLPWYRGPKNLGMEEESQTLCRYIQREIFPSSSAIVLDLHSGFGLRDRLWFPYAYSKRPFENIAEVYNLKDLFDKMHPNHVYQFEPQSKTYTTHGDLWDYLYLEHQKLKTDNLFLPLTLEIGSWAWIKKNPRQLFSAPGMFNPILPHRRKRVLRRHYQLFDFLVRATCSPDVWTFHRHADRLTIYDKAKKYWYDREKNPA